MEKLNRMKMKKVRVITQAVFISLIALTVMACGNTSNSKAEEQAESKNDIEQNVATADANEASKPNDVFNEYLQLKDALVADDKDKTAAVAEKFASTLKNLETSKYTEEQKATLNEILETAIEHAEHIAKSAIDHQREHFKELSTDMIDMVAITGTQTILYQQYCPMYDEGSAWLSNKEEIRNPYYGASMLTCGSVQNTIN